MMKQYSVLRSLYWYLSWYEGHTVLRNMYGAHRRHLKWSLRRFSELKLKYVALCLVLRGSPFSCCVSVRNLS